MAAPAFSVGTAVGGPNSGACNVGDVATEALIDSTPVQVSLPIGYNGAGSDSSTMFFCVWDVANPTHITGDPVSTYVANAANSNAWNVLFNS